MQQVIENPELRSRLGYQARQRAMQHFSLEQLAEKLEAFLEE
jgi:glycosyltransferase involved in cell wall biosynthesis